MKYTLLEMVQLILEAMDSDEVNDINDTTESRQVVSVIETTYNDIVSVIDFPEHWDLFELEPSGDSTRPTLMYLPDGVGKLDWIQYDCTEAGETVKVIRQVKPLTRPEFFNRMNGYDTAQDNVYQYNYLVGAESFDIRGNNDSFPEYYTLIGDRAILFDHFREDIESTLTANRSQCYGMKIPVFTRSNTFVPDLDARNFSLLFNEAKSQAFIEVKQIENAKAEQRARRAKVSAQRTKHRGEKKRGIDCAPAYGRKK
jgi:hypothetical protein